MKTLIDKLARTHHLDKAEFVHLIQGRTDELAQYLYEQARKQRETTFGTSVYLRGLIEISSYCKRNCYYCGIRRDNTSAIRYRLADNEIFECCRHGYRLGLRTFVLQGGDDPFFTDEHIIDIVRQIRRLFPDCAITLSIGEKNYKTYQQFFEAGTDRYLLRHETANATHYGQLHPKGMSCTHRVQCLHDLKAIGYQVGTGFMVGSPFQSADNLADDMLFIEEIQPQMIGIGPFIPHHATPFAHYAGGTVELTLFMLGLLRLMMPNVLLPATTALETLSPCGCELGLLAGANVIMPNITPVKDRQKYMIYDHKHTSGAETAESLAILVRRIESTGCHVRQSRGDAPNFPVD